MLVSFWTVANITHFIIRMYTKSQKKLNDGRTSLGCIKKKALICSLVCISGLDFFLSSFDYILGAVCVMVCRVCGSYYIYVYIGVNKVVEWSRIAAAVVFCLRRGCDGRCVWDALRANLFLLYKYAPMHISTCPRPSSMFSSRQSKCSGLWKYVNVLVCQGGNSLPVWLCKVTTRIDELSC